MTGQGDERWPPMSGSPARKALAHRVFELVKDGQLSYRDIATQLKLSSTSVVTRLYNEAIKEGMTEEIRDSELARLDAWGERLEETYEQAMSAGEFSVIPPLAVAAAKVSSERRKVLAVDVAPTLKVQHGTIGTQSEPEPWLKKAMEDWRKTPIYQDDVAASNGDE